MLVAWYGKCWWQSDQLCHQHPKIITIFPIFDSDSESQSMVRRTCNLWLTTRFVLVPVPCVDCSDAKLFGGFLFICFFSSTTGSSFNIPIVSFNGVFVKVIQISGYVFRWWTLYFGLNITRTHDILVNSRWQDHCTTALTSSE